MRWHVAGVVGMMASVHAGVSGAATLTTSGACDEADAIRRQVETLVQRPLESVDGWTFELRVERKAEQVLELRLRSREGAAVARERTIRGSNCGELADAAAIVIAMMIRDERDLGADQTEPPRGQTVPVERQLPSAPLSSPRRENARPAGGGDGQPAAPIAGFVGVGALIDAGTLPRASAGPALQLGAETSRVQFSIGGLMLPSSTVERDAGGRANFSLLAADVRGCFRILRVPVGSLVCVGHEVGRLAGEGDGVTHPRLGAALFQATGLELSLELALEDAFRLRLRAGAAFPLERRVFELDGERIHRPAAVVGRARLELELFQ